MELVAQQFQPSSFCISFILTFFLFSLPTWHLLILRLCPYACTDAFPLTTWRPVFNSHYDIYFSGALLQKTKGGRMKNEWKMITWRLKASRFTEVEEWARKAARKIHIYAAAEAEEKNYKLSLFFMNRKRCRGFTCFDEFFHVTTSLISHTASLGRWSNVNMT